MLAVVLILSACTALPTGPVAPICSFPEGTHFAYIGVSSAKALGLPGGDPTGGHYWVTSERVPFGSHPVSIPLGASVPPISRQACGVFENGGVVFIPGVPDNWHPPFDAAP